jgi:hypothetical protein
LYLGTPQFGYTLIYTSGVIRTPLLAHSLLATFAESTSPAERGADSHCYHSRRIDRWSEQILSLTHSLAFRGEYLIVVCEVLILICSY